MCESESEHYDVPNDYAHSKTIKIKCIFSHIKREVRKETRNKIRVL